MRPIFAALAVAAALAVPVHAADLRFPDDAALRAVQFVDENEGWCVGDAGVIWHTIDGGQSWERQPTGVRASLRSLHFLNPFTGWVVGREELPQGGSVGVILTTRDGGLKWQRQCIQGLPGLQRVRFFDDKSGITMGEGTDQYPTGVFTTADGGKNWKPLAGQRCPSWLAADFTDPQNGVLAGAWGRLATWQQGNLGVADVDTLSGRSVHDLRIVGHRAVAVGDGGLVLLSSKNAGKSWGFANLNLKTETVAGLDFHAVACKGEHIWVAGRPGSLMLHSADHGLTWETASTGRNLPLHGLFFLTEQRGWAVGELGTVLGTVDGGKTWTVQREGGQRSAALFIHARAGGVPFETVTLLGGEDGYFTTTLQVTGPDPASAMMSAAGAPQRLTAAMRLATGAASETCWQFPLPQHLKQAEPRELIGAWDRLHADRAADQMLRQLVLALRMWRPEVVVTDGKGDTLLDELIGEAVHEAYKRAADPTAFPEQIEQLGLKPWQVKKLYARCGDTASAQVVYDLGEAKQALQSTARDFAGPSLALCEQTAASQACYRLVASTLNGAANHRDLMQGIDLATGGTARRQREPLEEPSPDLERTIRTRRNLQALAETPAGRLTDPERLLAQIGPALAGMSDDQGAPAAFAIASQFARAGQWMLAREAFLLLVDRYPAHPLAADGYRWLLRYNSSSEARRRQELNHFINVTEATVQQAAPTDNGTPIRTSAEGVQKRQLTLLGDLAEARRWYQGCLQVEPRLASFGGVFSDDPPVQFCLQSARRSLGEFATASEWYRHFAQEHKDGPWRDAATAELWLTNRSGPSPKALALCRQSDTRPLLDGSFDDNCWQGLTPLKLKNAVGDTARDYPTEAWVAFDDDFLYVALRCKHPAERYVEPVKKRKRDEDLSAFDRVSLLLDLDRDYNTCYRLEIDQRGCLCEDCWGDRTWNPRWFVAVRSDPSGWQIEAAIPLAELTGEPVTLNRTWACNVVRILPGRGVQAWSTPADVQPRPEGMGLLVFTGDPAKAGKAASVVPLLAPRTKQ